MLIKQLNLRNYKQYKNLELQFKEGLVGIIGKNGAGKSTLFDAILYCLFGKDEDHKTLVRSTFSAPNSNIELELRFEIEQQSYKIKRIFKGKALTASSELYKDDTQIAKDMRPVNEEVAKLLNMERDAFKRSVFSGQKELAELSETTGEARKKMIRKMVGLEQLDDIQKKINSDIKSFKNQIIGQTQNLLTSEKVSALKEDEEKNEAERVLKASEKSKILETLSTKEKEYNIAKSNFEREELKFNRHLELQSEIGKSETRIEEFNKNIIALKEKKDNIEKAERECLLLSPQILSFENEKKEYSEMQIVYDKVLKRNYYSNQQKIWVNGLQVIEKKINEMKMQVSSLVQLKIKMEANVSNLSIQKNKKVAISLEREKILNDINSIKGKIMDRTEKVNKIVQIGKSGNCPTCFQSIRNVYDSTLQNMNNEIAEFQKAIISRHESELLKTDLNLKESEANIILLENERQELTKIISKLEQIEIQIQIEMENQLNNIKTINDNQIKIDAFGDLKLDKERFELLKLKIQNFDSQYLDYKKKESYINTELPLTKKQIVEIQSNLLSSTELIKQLKEQVLNLGFSIEIHEECKVNKSIIENQINEIKDLLFQKELELKDINNIIEQIKQIIQNHFDIVKQIEDKTSEIETLEKLSSIIGEFKTSILEKISPSISKEASMLFNRITKGKYENIKVDENFDFYILDNATYYPISRFSGGEIDLGNFCLRIAITKAIADLSGSKNTLNFLAFDEIFGSQDEERRYEIMLALNFLQEQFRQIYIISHVETIKEYFPNILEVTLENEGSEISWIS